MIWRHVIAITGLVALAACGGPSTQPDAAPPPDEILYEIVEPDPPPPLPDAVIETRDELLEIAAQDSIRRLSRRADEEPAFLSNTGDGDHYRHWDILRRTGFDPNAELIALLSEPYGVRQVGSETWFIWPDLATRPPEALAPERLSFQDAARLRALVGEQGLAQIAEGSAYPGIRTAISETGAWRYFLHETPQ
ncbi:MAG: hypothetical protein AAFO57_06270 [Pseudomonadota bacterium]